MGRVASASSNSEHRARESVARSLRHNAAVVSPQPSATRIDALGWALETSLSVVYAAGADGRVVFANAAARARWGDVATKETPALDLFAGEARGHLEEVAARVLTSGECGSFDAGELGPGGVRTWACFALSPLREGEAINGYLCIAKIGRAHV